MLNRIEPGEDGVYPTDNIAFLTDQAIIMLRAHTRNPDGTVYLPSQAARETAQKVAYPEQVLVGMFDAQPELFRKSLEGTDGINPQDFERPIDFFQAYLGMVLEYTMRREVPDLVKARYHRDSGELVARRTILE